MNDKKIIERRYINLDRLINKYLKILSDLKENPEQIQYLKELYENETDYFERLNLLEGIADSINRLDYKKELILYRIKEHTILLINFNKIK